MRTKRRKRKPNRRISETLIRDVVIADVRPFCSLSGPDARSGEPRKYLRSAAIYLTGKLTEPIRGSFDAEITLYESDEAKVGFLDALTAIGVVDPVRPLHAVLFIERPEFEVAWALALSGRLSHVRVHITPPRYRTAYVMYLAFSSGMIE